MVLTLYPEVQIDLLGIFGGISAWLWHHSVLLSCLILCNSDFATGVAGLSVAWGHWAGLPGT